MTGPSRASRRGASGVRARIVAIFALLIAANAGAWIWALLAFRDFPLQLGTAWLAYTLGLRHAVDADHIAAIDNVTRKQMQQGRHPVATGLFFSLGHSTVVVLASAAIAATATAFRSRLSALHDIGSLVGTLVSASFLLAIGVLNLFVLVAIVRTYRHVRSGGASAADEHDLLLAGGGVLTRLFRSLFGLVSRSWHMYPLGFLFGLGFDTATEVGLLGIAAASASQGLPIWSILVFPALFTAGMSLVDTADGVLMLGAYGWAFVDPVRKLRYNMAITAVSVIVALGVGMLEALNLVGAMLRLKGGAWDALGALGDNLGLVGALIVAVFGVTWALSALVHRLKGCDDPAVSNSTMPGETVS